jgi:hypothetical protein
MINSDFKAIKGKSVKDSIVSKLASSAGKLFSEAYEICSEETTDFEKVNARCLQLKEDIAYFYGKAELNKARAHYYRGNDDSNNAKYGEQISRFELSLKICKGVLASKNAKFMNNHQIADLRSLEELLQATIPKLKKDNELICKE